MLPVPLGLSWGGHLTDASLFAITLAALGLCLGWLALAARRHRRNSARCRSASTSPAPVARLRPRG